MLKKIQKVSYGSTNYKPLLAENEEPSKQNKVVPRRKSVPKLALYYTVMSGRAVLDVVDTMGEWLADFFGITLPLYLYVVEEHERQKSAERGISGAKESTSLSDNDQHVTADITLAAEG